MATLPAWDTLTKIVCSGCGEELYPIEMTPANATSELRDMYGTGDEITVTVTWTAIAKHDRKSCKNPASFGATVTYEKET